MCQRPDTKPLWVTKSGKFLQGLISWSCITANFVLTVQISISKHCLSKALLIKSTQKVKLTFQCLLYENELKKYKAFVNAQDGRLIFMLTCEYAYA